MLRIESMTEKSQTLQLHYAPFQDDIILCIKDVQSCLANLPTPVSTRDRPGLAFPMLFARQVCDVCSFVG